LCRLIRAGHGRIQDDRLMGKFVYKFVTNFTVSSIKQVYIVRNLPRDTTHTHVHVCPIQLSCTTWARIVCNKSTQVFFIVCVRARVYKSNFLHTRIHTYTYYFLNMYTHTRVLYWLPFASRAYMTVLHTVANNGLCTRNSYGIVLECVCLYVHILFADD